MTDTNILKGFLSVTSIEVSNRQAKVVPHSAVTHHILGTDLQHFGHICFGGFGCRCSERQHTAALNPLFQHVTQPEIGGPAVLYLDKFMYLMPVYLQHVT